jgi:hypothetical protein
MTQNSDNYREGLDQLRNMTEAEVNRIAQELLGEYAELVSATDATWFVYGGAMAVLTERTAAPGNGPAVMYSGANAYESRSASMKIKYIGVAVSTIANDNAYDQAA